MKKSYNLPLTEKIKAEQKVKQEEERKQLETEIRTLEDEIQYGKLNIAETLEKYVRKMEANADRYQNIAEDLQVAYSMRPHFKNLENMEAIKRKLQEDRKTRKQEEKRVAAASKLLSRRRDHIKILIRWRRQLGQAAGFVQKRQEQLVAVHPFFHCRDGFNADINAVPIFEQQQPGIALLIMAAYAKAIPVAEVIVLLLLQDDFPESVEP